MSDTQSTLNMHACSTSAISGHMCAVTANIENPGKPQAFIRRSEEKPSGSPLTAIGIGVGIAAGLGLFGGANK